METPTSLVIGQLANWLRGLTQRLDPGAGWYGEFLRRDPEGMRACLEGVAVPPWDVLDSLLADLADRAGAAGAGSVAREAQYAAGLRAAAVAARDATPDGARELPALFAAAAEQRAVSEAAVRILTGRLGSAGGDPAETAALERELSWSRDDAARAASRHTDLTARLRTSAPGPHPTRPAPTPTAAPRAGGAGGPGRAVGPGGAYGFDGAAGPGGGEAPGRGAAGEPLPAVPRQREARPHPAAFSAAEPPPEESDASAGVPVGRAEGRWLRGGARRSGGARYAGAANAQPLPFAPPPGQADPDAPAPGGVLPAPRGARFGIRNAATDAPDPRAAASDAPDAPAPDPGSRNPRTAGPGAPAPYADASGPDAPVRHAPGPQSPYTDAPAPGSPAPYGDTARPPAPYAAPAPGAGEASVGGFVARLLDLRARGLGGEAHALLCEAAGWPAALLPALAAGLGRAGLASDWATLLWEAASLPPVRLAEVAAALGDAGRDTDCGRLLRQGVARPAAEVADAALALGAAGREREAHALLGAFVGLRTAEEAAALARRDPGWFVPRLLHEARSLQGTRHRDLAHALRVAGLPGT
ncbi:hypothetical protein [Streptomyces sp. NPDC001568]|uniref:hypothetical protein n=1 Tax=Streptomyces sp. NPDC001568 TaxID=3364588 RepID=UPI0036C1BD64